MCRVNALTTIMNKLFRFNLNLYDSHEREARARRHRLDERKNLYIYLNYIQKINVF